MVDIKMKLVYGVGRNEVCFQSDVCTVLQKMRRNVKGSVVTIVEWLAVVWILQESPILFFTSSHPGSEIG
jgi:hypothetical protein